MKHSNIAFFVPHIGCPRQCSFCNQHAITGGAAPPTPQDVEATCRRAAEQLGENVKETQIAFFGGSFTAIPREYMVSLLEAAQNAVQTYGFQGIRCSTRPDAIDRETLELLQGYGMTAIELGAQSMSDKVLALNRRGHTAAQTVQAAGLIQDFGMELGLQMMTGLYGDTDDLACQTAESMVALRPDTARIYPTVVLPHTYLAELYGQGKYRPQTVEEAVSLCARLLPRFETAGIRVIRVGLHAEESVGNKMLAGAYHPAFRELVQSRIFLERLLEKLEQTGAGSYLVTVCPRDISVAVGNGKSNGKRLQELGYLVTFRQDGRLGRNEFAIEKQ